jgi:site-specific DNA-methyltransferase (adenine-specific)
MKTNVIYNQDCISGMLELPNGSVDIVVTSPPYNLNIQYGTYKDDLPRDSYLKWLHDVFDAVKHCLKNDGHFFLNVGYSNIDPWVGMDVANVARKLFVLQNNFTWVKSIHVNNKTSGHFKPINSDRFANPTWEHLFHFTKTGNVKCDKLAAGVPYEWNCNIDNSGRIRGRLVKNMGFDNYRHFEKTATEQQKLKLQHDLDKKLSKLEPQSTLRCRGNSWHIPYDTISNRAKERGKHPATFPVGLVEQCIKFSGVKKGVIVDPFMGSGTTAIAATNQGLDYIGFDIDRDYVEFARNRIAIETEKLPIDLLFEKIG